MYIPLPVIEGKIMPLRIELLHIDFSYILLTRYHLQFELCFFIVEKEAKISDAAIPVQNSFRLLLPSVFTYVNLTKNNDC